MNLEVILKKTNMKNVPLILLFLYCLAFTDRKTRRFGR